MAVHAVRLDESHCRGDGAQELVRNRHRLGRPLRCDGRSRGRTAVTGELEQARDAWMRGDDIASTALEELSPLAGDGVGILEVVLEQIVREAGVEAVDVSHLPTL
jgi:hypothetical protein